MKTTESEPLMTRILDHLRSNLVAYLALFVALGGTSYAAVTLPAGSVGTRQLRNHSITPIKLGGGFGGTIRAWAIVSPKGRLIAGNPRPKVGYDGYGPGGYSIFWPRRFAPRCATIATIDEDSPKTESVPVSGVASQPVTAGYASEVGTGPYKLGIGRHAHRISVTNVVTFNQLGQVTPLAFDVAVIC